MVEILFLLLAAEKISPFELIFGWLFSNVSNHPLPDLCMDKITKNLTGVHEHSSLITSAACIRLKDDQIQKQYNNEKCTCYKFLVVENAHKGSPQVGWHESRIDFV